MMMMTWLVEDTEEHDWSLDYGKAYLDQYNTVLYYLNIYSIHLFSSIKF